MSKIAALSILLTGSLAFAASCTGGSNRAQPAYNMDMEIVGNDGRTYALCYNRYGGADTSHAVFDGYWAQDAAAMIRRLLASNVCCIDCGNADSGCSGVSGISNADNCPLFNGSGSGPNFNQVEIDNWIELMNVVATANNVDMDLSAISPQLLLDSNGIAQSTVDLITGSDTC
jgi:hypothetical protein